MAFSRKIKIFTPENIEVKIILTRKWRLNLTSSLNYHLKGDKVLTEQQIILRIIFRCVKTFTYVVVNLLYEVYVFVKHSELLIVLRRYTYENLKTPMYEH